MEPEGRGEKNSLGKLGFFEFRETGGWYGFSKLA